MDPSPSNQLGTTGALLVYPTSKPNGMLVIRLYITALTLTFFIAVMMKGIGVLEAIVVVCPLIYMILDMREELRDLKSLEAQVSSLSR